MANGRPVAQSSTNLLWQLNMLETWRCEMIQKRKAPVDCFVIDDGWDDFKLLKQRVTPSKQPSPQLLHFVTVPKSCLTFGSPRAQNQCKMSA